MIDNMFLVKFRCCIAEILLVKFSPTLHHFPLVFLLVFFVNKVALTYLFCPQAQ